MAVQLVQSCTRFTILRWMSLVGNNLLSASSAKMRAVSCHLLRASVCDRTLSLEAAIPYRGTLNRLGRKIYVRPETSHTLVADILPATSSSCEYLHECQLQRIVIWSGGCALRVNAGCV